MPVTYADVWEFWLRHREIYEAVDFVTIHILPYWEDFPIRARYAAAHVGFDPQARWRGVSGQGNPDRRDRMAERRPDARGRAAVADQSGARHVRSARASRGGKISRQSDRGLRPAMEAALEGTVGGYWGLFDADRRALKYPAGERRSAIFRPGRWQMAAGMVYCVFLSLSSRVLAQRRKPWPPRWTAWVAVAIRRRRVVSLLGVAADKMCLESSALGGWLRWGPLLAAGVLTPVFAAVALIDGRALPTFVELIGPRAPCRDRSPLTVHARDLPARDRGDRAGDRARLRLRSALSGFSLRCADDGGGAVLAVGCC